MRERIIVAMKGACMGLADAIPGVSGGTMALILGIYERFIGAISALGPTTLGMMVRRPFWAALFSALIPGREAAPGYSVDAVTTMAHHVAFLINVLVGILTGILIGVLVLPVLMTSYPTAMRGFFFGLVLASILIPYDLIKQRSAMLLVFFLVATGGTWALMGISRSMSGSATTRVLMQTADGTPLTQDRTFEADQLHFATDTDQKKLKREIAFQPETDAVLRAGESSWSFAVIATTKGAPSNVGAESLVQVVDGRAHTLIEGFRVVQPEAATGGEDPALWYVFVCGAIAICAMLLPGVSGAFLLLMLGLYGFILHALRSLITAQDTSTLPVVAIFILGVVTGLLAFSRLLQWLLANYHDVTMACLAGLMLGSLRSLWPFRSGAGHLARNVMPSGFDSATIAAVVCAVIGIAIILILHAAGKRAAAS